MIKSTKAFLLAGASALAILASAAEANAETFTMPGEVLFPVLVSGEYAVELLGASGGSETVNFGPAGGLGAEVSGDISLTAGEHLTLFVGGQGVSGTFAGGGGGGSFVFGPTGVLAVAGGGGGAGLGAGGNGQAGTGGETGGAGGTYGGPGGVGGTGGGGGGAGGLAGGGGGAGVNTGAGGYGGNGGGPSAGFGGKFPKGGAGSAPVGGGAGGFGGGGGGGTGGGGGSGYSGGGGGYGGNFGGGGGSFLALQFTDQLLKGGVNSGNGSISITSVPEPSAWAMMLVGFAGLGWLAHARRRKTSPA
jgi:PEP-CTERM motif